MNDGLVEANMTRVRRLDPGTAKETRATGWVVAWVTSYDGVVGVVLWDDGAITSERLHNLVWRAAPGRTRPALPADP